eukprot:COSAG03_NODE_734_length_6051_cov_2.406250_2_plen_400_part_00
MTDVALVTDVLNSTNLVPKMALVAEVEDIDAVLADDTAQDAYRQLLVQDIAVSLGVDATQVKISGLRQAGGAQGTGRRAQTGNQLAFDVEIVGDVDSGAMFAALQQQLDDPGSTLRSSDTAGNIRPGSAEFSFSCPIGLYRPIGAAQCGNCDDKSIPDSANDFRTCKECLPGQSPDATHSQCVCADGYYNSSAGTNMIKCYAEGETFSVLGMPDTSADCQLCADTGCTDDAITCSRGTVTLQEGFALSQAGLAQGLVLNDIEGQRNIYECAIKTACRGDDPQVPCGAGYTGPLCDYCAEGYSRPGFNGGCMECSEGLSTAWVVLAGLGAVVAVTMGLYVVSSVDGETGKMAVLVTLGKIAVGLIQVITQLEFCLQLIWPITFRWYVCTLRSSPFVSCAV